MLTPNRDIFAAKASQDYYHAIGPLLTSPLLDTEFQKRDKAANQAKSRYHKLGQFAIVLVAMSAIFTIAEALILSGIFKNVILTFAVAVMAGIGITLQLYLILTKQKTKWLLNRFATERLRSLKFQAFSLADHAESTQDLKKLVEAYMWDKLAKLDNELNTGIAVLRNFKPSDVLEKREQSQLSKNAELTNLAREAYMELRVNYQKNFALSEITSFTGRRRIFNSSQDMIYLAAAVFAFISLGAKIVDHFGSGIDTGWIDFLAVTLFVLGATEAIMDNALLEEQSQTRFEQYARDIDEVTDGTNKKKHEFQQWGFISIGRRYGEGLFR